MCCWKHWRRIIGVPATLLKGQLMTCPHFWGCEYAGWMETRRELEGMIAEDG